MRELIQRLRSITDIVVAEQASSWHLKVLKPDELEFTITVPFQVFEWFAHATDAKGDQLWSDWIDYYPIRNETTQGMKAAMSSDVERFVSILVDSPVRRSTAMHGLEWKRNEIWSQIAVAVI